MSKSKCDLEHAVLPMASDWIHDTIGLQLTIWMRTSPSPPPRSKQLRFVGHGYRPGVSQPAGSVTFSWICPEELLREPEHALQQLDAWLGGPLALTLLPEPDWTRGDAQGSSRAIRRGAWRILQLASELLRLIRVPVFDPGVTEQIAPDPAVAAGWRIHARVPMHDQQPTQLYVDTYERSAQLITQLLSTPNDTKSIEQIQAQIESEHIEHLSPFTVALKSTIPLLQAAHERGIPFRHFGGGIYQLGWGCRARLFRGGANDLDTAIGSSFCHNKFLTAKLLTTAGLPVPAQRFAMDVDQALAAAQQLGWPIVVKPADRERGEGVSIGITTHQQVQDAWHTARKFSSSILVEKQVEGICHRLHVMAGQVISVTKRLPKAVRGDGRHTVRELIAIANHEQKQRPPWSRLKPFPSDELARTCLERDGLSLDGVPSEGQWALLRPFSSIAWGGVLENCTETVHPDNVAAAVRAARICKLSNAGIDMISRDISVPWHLNGAVINEVNYSPQTRPAEGFEFMLDRILTHYFPEAGRIPVTVYIGGHRALKAAGDRQKQLIEQGVACALVAADRSLDPSGEPLILAADGLFDRCLALLYDPKVESLVVALQSSEWLVTGLPFDRVDRVIDCGDLLLHTGKLPQRVARARLKAMLEH